MSKSYLSVHFVTWTPVSVLIVSSPGREGVALAPSRMHPEGLSSEPTYINQHTSGQCLAQMFRKAQAEHRYTQLFLILSASALKAAALYHPASKAI